MRRVIAIAIIGASLAGCSTFDSLKPTPPSVQVQLESIPSGADAKTSLGPGCKTPCSVAIPAAEAGFSITFTLARHAPVTVPVQVINNPGDFSTPASTTLDPNPVVAELKREGPPPKTAPKGATPKKPKPPTSASTPAAGSPSPNRPAPPPPTR